MPFGHVWSSCNLVLTLNSLFRIMFLHTEYTCVFDAHEKTRIVVLEKMSFGTQLITLEVVPFRMLFTSSPYQVSVPLLSQFNK